MHKKKSAHVLSKCLLQLLMATLLFVAAGCDKAKARMVGKWKIGDEPNVTIWEFEPSGAAVSGNIRGRFVMGDQNRVRIQTPTATFVYQVEFPSEDLMIWNDPNGTRMELTRVK